MIVRQLGKGVEGEYVQGGVWVVQTAEVFENQKRL